MDVCAQAVADSKVHIGEPFELGHANSKSGLLNSFRGSAQASVRLLESVEKRSKRRNGCGGVKRRGAWELCLCWQVEQRDEVGTGARDGLYTPEPLFEKGGELHLGAEHVLLKSAPDSVSRFGGGRELAKKLGLAQDDYTVTFQSRLSKDWVTPFTDVTLEQMRDEGKHKKVALTACMRKLITILNAMVRDQKEWQHAM